MLMEVKINLGYQDKPFIEELSVKFKRIRLHRSLASSVIKSFLMLLSLLKPDGNSRK